MEIDRNTHLQITITIGGLSFPLIIKREEEEEYRIAQKEVIHQITEFKDKGKEHDTEEMLIKLLYFSVLKNCKYLIN